MNPSIVGLDGKPYDTEFDYSKQINFGKTKIIAPWEDGLAVNHKDIITAFDNSDFTGNAPGKGTASAYSSAILFKRLEEYGIETSHLGILNSNTTIEKDLEMLPLELIWRRYNVKGNSWEKRNPGIFQEGEKYPEIKYEVCLKWSVIDENGKKIDDPFFDLDNNFQPKIQENGLPILMHPKEPNKRLNYNKIVHPNKGNDISKEELEELISKFIQYSSEIREMMEKVQDTTFQTYAEIGRLNADGKGEVGIDKRTGKLTLGDELELDSLRNMSIKELLMLMKSENNLVSSENSTIYKFKSDILGKNLGDVIAGIDTIFIAEEITRIIKADHSGKQVYRDLTENWKNIEFGPERQKANDAAAELVTNTIYLPVAKALSDRFGKKVGYILQNN